MLRAATGHVASQRVAEKTGFTVPRIIGPNITMPVGTRVVPLPEGDRYLGFIFGRAERPAEVEQALRDAHALLDVRIAVSPIAVAVK